jgi:hypothetical protein
MSWILIACATLALCCLVYGVFLLSTNPDRDVSGFSRRVVAIVVLVWAFAFATCAALTLGIGGFFR